ncbi:MAG TPA: glycosyltransferase [Candidatus Krumholzibacteria bacterium]|nr:glycosyltransferase [Candidatus Krumholzibacteria bacterium]HPD72024.1 glycosyltransferase [Candidatus Krumholzibacteria bacterium]HRY41043.1 glycosyltransferase [Candidatus Krumholzibacteria bacterium]
MEHPETNWPPVTIVIPAFNEERHLEACLSSLRDLDYPRDRLEIIVVDNGSTDRTGTIARGGGARVLELPRGFVGAVRNLGAASASGEFVAFLDADCVPLSTWLRDGVRALLDDPGLGAVGGIYLAPAQATWLEKAWAQRPQTRPGRVLGLAGSSLVVSRATFSALGGFDETMTAGEDYEFCRRVRAAGLALLSLPGCAVYHLGWPKSFREIYRRQVWQGSNQLQAASGVLDRALILVHLFALAPFGVLGLGLARGFASPWTWSPLLLMAAVPLLASFHRGRTYTGLRAQLGKTAALYPIFVCYYLGRVVGLALNYRDLLFGRSGRSTKTWTRSQRG